MRTGLSLTGLASILLLATVQPELDESSFAFAMGVLGLGMGLIASQLGNVVQSSVDASGRGEAGGLQYTGQQLGSSIGVALIGGVVLAGLASGFVSNVQADERLDDTIEQQVVVAVEDGIDFVSTDSVEQAATEAGLADDAGGGDRRGLRRRTAPGAQDRTAGGGAPRPRLARLHGEPAELGGIARRRGSRRRSRAVRVSPSSGVSVASRCGHPDGRAPRASGAAGCGPPRTR